MICKAAASGDGCAPVLLLYTVVTATANYRYTTEIAPCDPTRCQAMPSTSAWNCSASS